jgi:hypothetical protein
MAKTKKKTGPALAYLRTSSAANIGSDKDSEKRQRAALMSGVVLVCGILEQLVDGGSGGGVASCLA